MFKLTPTKLFIFLMMILAFLFVSIGIIGPIGMSEPNNLIVALTMTYVFVIVPIATFKMVSLAWRDLKEFMLHEGVESSNKTNGEV